ncbi:MAG: lysophospholipid acyltransferase family protein [Gemmatimonadaceae bacterium]
MSDSLDWRTRGLVRLGGWLLTALGATWRVRVIGREALLARPADAPRVVLTLWHGQMLPILWAHRQPTAVLISEHRDGEIIARIVARFGFSSVRGSTSRGGARALLACVQAVQEGADVAITPDGPRGPRHQFAPGALVVAFRAGVPVVPLVAHVDRAWRLRSWDAFEIPKPFARVTIVYGAPRPVDGADVRAVSERHPEFAGYMQDDMAAAAMHAAER